MNSIVEYAVQFSVQDLTHQRFVELLMKILPNIVYAMSSEMHDVEVGKKKDLSPICGRMKALLDEYNSVIEAEAAAKEKEEKQAKADSEKSYEN